MKKYHVLFVLVAIFALFTIISCSTSKGMQKWEDSSYATMMSDYDGYQSWFKVNEETITGDPFNALGPAHAGKEGFREVYINKTGKAVSMGKADYPYPVGTIIVKETYKGDGGMKGMLDSLTIMIKRSSGYDPANNNWEYMMVTPDDEIMAQGKLDGCIGCHSQVSGDDFVFNNRMM
jgi:hypothetical protein